MTDGWDALSYTFRPRNAPLECSNVQLNGKEVC